MVVAREKYLKELEANEVKKNKLSEVVSYKSEYKFGEREAKEEIANKWIYDRNGYLLSDFNCSYKYDGNYNILSQDYGAEKYVYEYDANNILTKEKGYNCRNSTEGLKYVDIYKNDGNVFTSVTEYDDEGKKKFAAIFSFTIIDDFYKDNLDKNNHPFYYLYSNKMLIVYNQYGDCLEKSGYNGGIQLFQDYYFNGNKINKIRTIKETTRELYVHALKGEAVDNIYDENFTLIEQIQYDYDLRIVRTIKYDNNIKGLTESAMEYDRDNNPIAYYRFVHKKFK
jgi:hypothetical protein